MYKTIIYLYRIHGNNCVTYPARGKNNFKREEKI
jgi:hypothetical protein